MAVTRKGRVIDFAAAGDTVTDRLVLSALLINHVTATATVIKDGSAAATILFTIPAVMPTGTIMLAGADPLVFDEGLELDAVGATGTMTAFLA